MSAPKVLFIMADYGHDPTETAVPFMAFKDAGFDVEFATENGKQPECDKKMRQGITQKLLGANSAALTAYKTMLSLPPIQSPLSWSSPSFTLEPYNLLFFPGGHEKGVRQVIDSPIVHEHVASYFPQTFRQPSSGSPPTRSIAAVCHGVMVLSSSTYPSPHPSDPSLSGKSVLYDVETTALPAFFEKVAFHGTRLFLGDYYKTYGAGSEDVQESVSKKLKHKSQFKNSTGLSPFVIEDPKYRYISARWPGDANALAGRVVAMVRGEVGNGEK